MVLVFGFLPDIWGEKHVSETKFRVLEYDKKQMFPVETWKLRDSRRADKVWSYCFQKERIWIVRKHLISATCRMMIMVEMFSWPVFQQQVSDATDVFCLSAETKWKTSVSPGCYSSSDVLLDLTLCYSSQTGQNRTIQPAGCWFVWIPDEHVD